MSNSRSEAPRSLIGTGRIFWNSGATEEKPWLPHYGGYLVINGLRFKLQGRRASNDNGKFVQISVASDPIPAEFWPTKEIPHGNNYGERESLTIPATD